MTIINSQLLLSLMLLLNQPRSAPQQPSDIFVPTALPTTVLDGRCNDFDSTEAIPWPDDTPNASPATVYIAHNRDNLLVCVQAPPGLLYERWIGVYLDPQADALQEGWAQPNDWSLQINMALGTISSQTGNGTGGYLPSVTVWSGKRILANDSESAEFAIPLYGLHLGECGRAFRMAIAHQWVNAVGDDHFWPKGVAYNRPTTWAQATITGTLCPDNLTHRTYLPQFSFNGNVTP